MGAALIRRHGCLQVNAPTPLKRRVRFIALLLVGVYAGSPLPQIFARVESANVIRSPSPDQDSMSVIMVLVVTFKSPLPRLAF